MSETIFQQIAKGKPTSIPPHAYLSAREWFRQAAQKVTDFNPRTLFRQMEKMLVPDINETSIGSMYLYSYDPKLKATLPYYDTYPLVFICDLYNDGWLGINLHYLPPYHRAKLMDALYGITLKENDRMKVQLSYGVLKGASRFRYFRPCVKRYLSDHLRSKPLFIEPNKWDMAMMLPLARFVKAPEEIIWRDSMRTF